MSLVDELVVRRSGAALMNAEEVLLGNIYELIQKGDTKEKKKKQCWISRRIKQWPS